MDVFKIVLPGSNVHQSRLEDKVIDSLYSNPKINVVARPSHASVISLNWNNPTPVAYNITKILYSFSHNYDYVPTVFASYSFDDGSNLRNAILPFQYGGLGMIVMDADIKNVNLKYLSLDLSSAAAIPTFIMKIRFYVMAERGYQ